MTESIKQSRPAEVLLVEDSPTDVALTRKGFEKAKLLLNLHHVENGEECMQFLRKEDGYNDVPTPDLILLDLNMPRMDGREVLAELVKDDSLNHLPVVVLTTSDEEADILNMYKLRCSSYLKKPVDFPSFSKMISDMGEYWFGLVVLPTGKA